MYVLEQAIEREQFAEEIEKRYLDFIKGDTGAALRRVHRQRDPEGLSRILSANTARTCSTATSPMPMPGSRTSDFKDPGHRPGARPGGAQPGVDQDREAGRHRQSEGFPQRGGEVRPARPGRQREGKNPSWTSYEKIREVIEKRMFSQVEDLLPVISFGVKKEVETEKQARRILRAHDGPRLHRAAGAPPGRVVYAREAGGVTERGLRS